MKHSIFTQLNPERLGRLFCLLVIMTVLIFGNAGLSSSNASSDTKSALPPGFVARTIVDGLTSPNDMAFLPNGDIFILEKGHLTSDDDGIGAVRLYKNGALRTEPVMQLHVYPNVDRGMTALALDPDFVNNGYIYIYHTVWNRDRPDMDILYYERLSRFTYDHVRGTADVASEEILFNIYEGGLYHQGGDLKFDNAGYLYLTIGDFFSDFDDELSQDLSRAHGKLLRIKPTYDGSMPPYVVPADNPYISDPDALPEIYASGLRNPWRMAYSEQSDQLFIADVGREHYEEINIVESGANFGRPTPEGDCPLSTWEPCAAADPMFTAPIFTSAHMETERGYEGAISAVDIYEGTQWPVQYHNKLFYADYVFSYIRVLDLDTGESTLFDDNAIYAGDMTFSNDRLYFVNAINGKIVEYTYTGTDNSFPVASVSADVNEGAAPLAVTFSAMASDPDGDPLTYHWDFGDGTTTMTTEPTVSHVYESDATATAVLSVSDDQGATSNTTSAVVTVYSNPMPTIELENMARNSTDTYQAEDTWRYSVGLPDSERAGKTFKWDIIFHHYGHIHPYRTGLYQDEGELFIPPESHDGDSGIWYEWVLTMYTETGQPVQVSQEIFPELVNVQINSVPDETSLWVNERPRTATFNFDSVIGQENEVSLREMDNVPVLVVWETEDYQTATDEFQFYASNLPETYTVTTHIAEETSGIVGGNILGDIDGAADSGDEQPDTGNYTVTLTDASDLSVLTTQSRQGAYVLTSVPAGTYTVSIEAMNSADISVAYGHDMLLTVTAASVATHHIGITPSPTGVDLSQNSGRTSIYLPIVALASLCTLTAVTQNVCGRQ